ncbi:DUF3575 domain-containing protein [Chryseobacterium sp. Alg-005]|uniref:DUF3575 domain-containing protein n=1 Tax=Chryseobacterium sp. Alg-005 TaxID=3159516 RepID=UPI0036F300B8
MKNKLLISLFALFLIGNLNAQEEKSLYIKGNALFIPIGVFNAGLEYQLSSKYTLQGDVFISPWKSFAGNHAQIYMGHLEGRYYFKEAFKRWYVGINGGIGLFDLTKWNYQGAEKFQRGFSIMAGATVGYQFQWKERWNIDVYLGGGTSQGFYHGYENIPPDSFTRYDGAEGWNRSGEILPYRGGIMISYQLK